MKHPNIPTGIIGVVIYSRISAFLEDDKDAARGKKCLSGIPYADIGKVKHVCASVLPENKKHLLKVCHASANSSDRGSFQSALSHVIMALISFLHNGGGGLSPERRLFIRSFLSAARRYDAVEARRGRVARTAQ